MACAPELLESPVPKLERSEEEFFFNTTNRIEDYSINLADYSPSIWLEVVQVGVPTIGVALLAISHPILFLAGASFTLVGGYLYQEGYCTEAREGDGMPSIAKVSLLDADDEEAAGDLESDHAESEPPTQGNNDDKTTQTQADMTKSRDKHEQEHHQHQEMPLPLPLQIPILENERFSALQAKDCFAIFFSNEAPFSFQDFQKQRGDTNISYGTWSVSSPPVRVLKFQTPTKSPFSSYASATKTQRLVRCTSSCVIMESKTTLEDIPFCQYFFVQERWVWNSCHGEDTVLSVSAQVVMYKSCPFDAQIKSKSMSTLREALEAWCQMAQKAVWITQNRKQQQMVQSGNETIEVEYSPNHPGRDEGIWDSTTPPRKSSPIKQAFHRSFSKLTASFTSRRGHK